MKIILIFLWLTAFLVVEAKVGRPRRSSKYLEDSDRGFGHEEHRPAVNKYVKDDESDSINSGRCDCQIHPKNKIIRAVDFDVSLYGIREHSEGLDFITNLTNGAILTYYNVDFGNNASLLKLRYSNGQKSLQPSRVIVATDYPHAAIASFYVHNTGGKSKFIILNAYFHNVSGIHAVYFRFKVDPNYPKDGAMDFVSFSFDSGQPNCLNPLSLQPNLLSTVADEHKVQLSYNDDSKIINGADFNATNYAYGANICDLRVATNIIDDTFIEYYDVDFGKQKSIIHMQIVSDLINEPKTQIEVHLDDRKLSVHQKQLVGSLGEQSNNTCRMKFLDIQIPPLSAIFVAEARIAKQKRRSHRKPDGGTGDFETEEIEPAADKYLKDKDEETDGRINRERCDCHIHPSNGVIKAIDYNHTRYGVRAQSCHQDVVTNLSTGAQLHYYNVDFGTEATDIKISYSNCQKSPKPSKVIVSFKYLHAVFASFDIPSSGGKCNFTTQAQHFLANITGIYPVYFRFFTDPQYPGDEAMDFLWFTIYRGPSKCMDPLTAQPKMISPVEDEYQKPSPNDDEEFKVINGADFNKTNYAVVATVCDGLRVASNIINDTFLLYDDVDFGDQKPKIIRINSVSEQTHPPGAYIGVYLVDKFSRGSQKKLIGSFANKKLDPDACDSLLLDIAITEVTGVHNLLFPGDDSFDSEQAVKDDESDKNINSGRCECHIHPSNSVIKAIDYNWTKYGVLAQIGHQDVVTNLTNGAQLHYYNVDFGTEATDIKISYSNCQKTPKPSKVIVSFKYLHAVFASFDIPSSGGKCNFTTQAQHFLANITGIYPVYFRFFTDPQYPGDEAMDFLWFTIYRGPSKCMDPLTAQPKMISPVEDEYQKPSPNDDEDYKVINGADFNKTNHAVVATVCDDLRVASNIINNTFLQFDDVDFGDQKPKIIRIKSVSDQTDPPAASDDSFESEQAVKDDDSDRNINSGRCDCHIHPSNSVIQAKDYNWTNTGIHNYSCNQNVVTNLKFAAALFYYNVDFGTNATTLKISFSNSQKSLKSSRVIVAFKYPQKVLTLFYVHNTGGRCNFTTITAKFPSLSGVYNVYFFFYTDLLYPEDEALDFLWFTIYRGPSKCMDPLTLQPTLLSTAEDEHKRQLSNKNDDYVTYDGADYSASNHASKDMSCYAPVATHIINNTYLDFYNVDFLDHGPKYFRFQFTCEKGYCRSDFLLQIYLADEKLPLAQKQLIDSSDRQIRPRPRPKPLCNFKDYHTKLENVITGIHNVRFVFVVISPDPNEETYDLRWWGLFDY
ncbi:hypothetical protein CHUAL_012196 [Chamberlinius hualienensis]